MEICPIRSCGLLNFCAYGSTYNVIFMFTAKLNAQMDELEALLAATTRDNNDNATQNGLVAEIGELKALIAAPAATSTQHKMVIIIRYLHTSGMILSYNIMGICLLRNVERWYNVISRFTAELVAEIDELEALIAAPVRNNNENATQNGNYHSIFAYVLVYNIMEYVCYIT